MDLTSLIPANLHAPLAWLGKRANTFTSHPSEVVNGVPHTQIEWEPSKLQPDGTPEGNTALEIMRILYREKKILEIYQLVATGELIANGPKLFRPTEEQFDSMIQVQLHLKPSEVKLPYPAFVIEVPPGVRRSLAQQFNLTPNHIPQGVFLHQKNNPPSHTTLIVVKLPSLHAEEAFIFSEGSPFQDIEDVLSRRVIDNRVVKREEVAEEEWNCKLMAATLSRASLNLAIMLTHFGHNLGGPIDPVAYKKHRKNKNLQHMRHRDFLAIEMKQNIVVRQTKQPTLNPEGPGTGIEVKPHWRKGHWRAYPGQAALRASGQQVPLLFVRPCLVRADRVQGDIAQSEVNYLGK